MRSLWEFAFKLCLALGKEHPDKLSLTAEQAGQWLWFYKAFGFGDDRADDRVFAALFAFNGAKVDQTRWPYFPRERSTEERQQHFEAVMEAIRNAARQNDNIANPFGRNDGQGGQTAAELEQ